MKHPRFLGILTFLLATFSVGPAQTPEKCPLILIEVSAIKVDDATPLVFTARFNTVVPTAKPEFKWQSSVGTITAGEGTASITVDTAGLGGQVVTATVEVGGVSTTCSTVATRTVEVSQVWPVCDRPFDEYGDISAEDEQARLDNFAVELSNYQGSTGYVFVYAGKQTYEGEADERLRRAKNYLVNVRQIDSARVTAVDGGYREELVVALIIVPPGAALPSATPTLSPGEIELTKRRPTRSPKRKTRKLTPGGNDI